MLHNLANLKPSSPQAQPLCQQVTSEVICSKLKTNCDLSKEN